MDEIKETLQQALRSFRILGTASQDEIIKRLDERVNNAALEAIKNEYYQRGGLAGRMLLRAWGQHNPDLGTKFAEWLQDDPVPQSGNFATKIGTCALWHTTSIQLAPAHLALLEKAKVPSPESYYTPFGPEKAEDDPRLCGLKIPSTDKYIPPLFYDKMPWYAKLTAEQHSFFFAPRGCGRTAAIWQARHTHRITGYKPSLSLYLSLRPPYEPAHLLNLVSDALGRAFLCALVEDAYWFTAAEHEIQADIGRFLLWWAGDIAILLRRLRSGGLPVTATPVRKIGDKSDAFYDGRLLTDVLGSHFPLSHIQWDDVIAIARAARVAIGKVYPTVQEDWNYPIYLWIDSYLPEGIVAEELTLLWEHEFLRQIGNLKIFTQTEIPGQEQIRMEWDDLHLRNMLDHRLKQVGAHLFLDDDIHESIRKFEKETKTDLPQGVIRRGNRLFETLGGHLIAGS